MHMDALLYAFSNLKQTIEDNWSDGMSHLVQSILEKYAYPALSNNHPMVQARACEVYWKYGNIEFTNEGHLLAAANLIL